MSFRISVLALALLAGTPVTHAATLRVDGEVYAQRSVQLVPPAVDRLWQFNLTQLAPDGSSGIKACLLPVVLHYSSSGPLN